MRKHTVKLLLFILAWISIVLGVVGIFLPIMPTTPFILLAGFCFARSSPRFHSWLLNHRFFGPIVDSFESGKGISRKVRFRAVAALWFSIVVSIVIVAQWWALAMLGCIGFGVSWYIYRMPVFDEPERVQ